MNRSTASQPNKLFKLEALRGAAAIYVFLHHSHIFKNQGLGRLFYFGQEAVIAFFLLSGFVIYYSTYNKNITYQEYLKQRIKRIYPIFIASLAIAYISQSLISNSFLDADFFQLTGNILMLQDTASLKEGVWINTYYGNSPLWSLSYEWWFYMLYIPLGIVKGTVIQNKNQLTAFCISLIGFLGYQIYPNQLCLFAGYFYIWWAGVELSREFAQQSRLSFRGQSATLFGLVTMTTLWAIPIIYQIANSQNLQLGISPVLQFRHHVAALIFVMLGIVISSQKITINKTLLLPFVRLAPISYALYSIHQPVLNVSSFYLQEFATWKQTLLAFILILPLSWLLEIKMQSFFKRKPSTNE